MNHAPDDERDHYDYPIGDDLDPMGCAVLILVVMIVFGVFAERIFG